MEKAHRPTLKNTKNVSVKTCAINWPLAHNIFGRLDLIYDRFVLAIAIL